MEHPGLPSPSEHDHLALDDLDDLSLSTAARAQALDQLRPLLHDICSALSRQSAEALTHLAVAEPQMIGALGVDTLSCGWSENPMDFLTVPLGRSLVAEALGAQLDAGVRQSLEQFAADGDDSAGEALDALTRRAYDQAQCTPGLRRYRLDLLKGFHPQVRASALATFDPSRLALAESLAHRIADTDELLAAFDQARAEADVEADDMAPGPPRHFSWVHAAFAAIILALSAYHYLAR